MKLLKRWSWKRSAVAAVSLAVIALASAYLYATRPSRLRSALIAALDRFESLRLAEATLSFSLLNGLHIRDLRVVLAESSPLCEVLTDPQQRVVLRVDRAQVRLNRWALLLGRVVPVELRVEQADINVIRDPASGRLNLTLRPDGSANFNPRRGLPLIIISGADLRISTVRGGRLRSLEQFRLDARGEMEGEDFVLNVSAADRDHAAIGALRWNRMTGKVVVNLEWTRLETIMGLLPPVYARLEEKLHLSGRARLTGGLITGGALTGATVEFEQLRASLPVGDAGWELPPQSRFLHVADAKGTLHISNEQVTATVAAAVNGAAVEVRIETTIDREHPPHSAYVMDVKVERLNLPSINDVKDAAFFKDLPPGLKAFFENYQPETAISADLTLTREAGADKAPTADGWVDFHDGPANYFRFPYQFQHARGRVRFSPEGITLENIQAEHGSARVTVNGKISHARSWTAFDLDIRAANVPLDADLYAAIPDKFHAIWNEMSPIGLSDVTVAIHREEGSRDDGPRQTETRIDAHLKGASLSVGDDRRLTHVDGRITIADRVTTIHRLHGFLDEADVYVAGTIASETEGGPASTSLTVTAANVRIDHLVGGTKDAPAFKLSGIGDVWGRIRRNGDPQANDDRFVIHVREGSIVAGDAPQPWLITDGWFNQSRAGLEIVELSARQAQAWLNVSGSVPSPDSTEPLRLDIRAGDIAMDTLAQQVPPGHWRDACEKLGFAGKGRVSVKLAPDNSAEGAGRQTAEIHLEAERFKPRALPMEFEDAVAHFVVYPDHCELLRLSARYGDTGGIEAGGRIGWDERHNWSEIAIRAADLDVDEDVITAMPEKLRGFFERMSLKGRIDLRLDQISYDSEAGGSWGFSGSLKLRDATLNVGLPLAECSGEIIGNGRLGPGDQSRFDAQFTVESGRLAGRPIEHWRGKIARLEGESLVLLDDLEGGLAGGQASGSASFDPASSKFELGLTMNNVSFEQFLNRGEQPARGTEGARIDGNFWVRGTMGRPGDRTGGGSLAIRRASLLGTPIVRLVVRKQSTDDERAINDELNLAELEFRLSGDVVYLEKADIQSRDLRLVGEGRWNLADNSIDLRLVGVHPKHWLRVPILSDLVERIGREAIQYHVSGPARSPRVVVEPLPDLTEMLRRLLKPLAASSRSQPSGRAPR